MSRPTHNVLLVEDSDLAANVIEQMLRKSPFCRYCLKHKATLARAQAALQTEEIEVVLLDLGLPDSDGLETLSRVIESAPDIPVIVLTATQNAEAGHRAIKLGAQDFLHKGEFNYLMLDRAIVYGIERHRLQRTIKELAVLDELTGLYNRRGFVTLNPDVFERARRTGGRGYLIFFDLDRFKQINDELGHQKGDEALVEFAANLRSIFRKDALLVRLGGDEFVAMGVEGDAGQAEGAINALRVVLDVRNQTENSAFRLEASAGVTYFDPENPPRLEELSAAADAALYLDKESRRLFRRAGPAQLQEGRV